MPFSHLTKLRPKDGERKPIVDRSTLIRIEKYILHTTISTLIEITYKVKRESMAIL